MGKENIGQEFIQALAEHTAERYQTLLTEDVGLRIWDWQGNELRRPREKVVERLICEWIELSEPFIECVSVLASANRVALEFRIRTHEQAHYLMRNYSAFLTLEGDQIGMIDLYTARPVPARVPTGWIAPQTVSDAELEELLESVHAGDPRTRMPDSVRFHLMSDLAVGGLDVAGPGSNFVYLARLPEPEADERINAVIAFHRERGIGFNWMVGPLDTPADLGERLERHGLLYAGSESVMVRRGLDDLEIPVNPELTIEIVDCHDPVKFSQAVRIITTCFHMPAEDVESWQKMWLDEFTHPIPGREELIYNALLDDKPIANARLILQGGLAYLGGAGTLPEYRGHKVYSTLLRKRLEDARTRGYEIAMIEAGPMSRRVVARYGFKEYGKKRIYGWMPVMDPAVIRQMVPDE